MSFYHEKSLRFRSRMVRVAVGAVVAVALFGSGGCGRNEAVSEWDPPPPIHNRSVGKWVNRHAGEAGLAGVRVQQFPDCEGEEAPYEGRHPAMILYVFKNGRVNQTCFTPDGTMEQDFWFTIEPDDCLWETMDRSYATPASDAR